MEDTIKFEAEDKIQFESEEELVQFFRGVAEGIVKELSKPIERPDFSNLKSNSDLPSLTEEEFRTLLRAKKGSLRDIL